MVNNKERANAHFGALSRTKWLLSDEADDAIKEFEQFLGDGCTQFKEKCDAFDQDQDLLD